MGTLMGEIKALRLAALVNMRVSGLNAMDLEPGDELVSVRLGHPEDDVMMVTAKGQAVRFGVGEITVRSRAAGGVRGIRLAAGDSLVGMEVVQPQNTILVVSAQGFGKLVQISKFRRQAKGGIGTRCFRTSSTTGLVAGARGGGRPG